MRRWVRYEAPIMVCIDLDETGYTGTVVNVVLGTDPDDVALARDYRGQFLVYDEAVQQIETDEETEGRAIKSLSTGSGPTAFTGKTAPTPCATPASTTRTRPSPVRVPSPRPCHASTTRRRSVGMPRSRTWRPGTATQAPGR